MNLLFFFSIQIYMISSSIISFPFERIIEDRDITTDNFLEVYFPNNIYTKSYVGTPPTEIALQIKSKQYTLCFRNDSIYHYSESSTYKANDTKEIRIFNIDFSYAIRANETFKFGKEKINIDNLKFILSKESKYKSEGVLGLQILENDKDVWGYNLIPQLKEKKAIEKEVFFFIFEENSDNGELIIGQYPHLIEKYKNIYHEKQFLKTTAYITGSTQNFDFKFRSIFWNDMEVESLSIGYIEAERYMMKGSMKFWDKAWNFFSPHIRNRKCNKTVVHVLYETYVCDDYEDFDITKFPSIKFYMNDADYSFELTYEDIFIKKDGKVFFMICFDKLGYDVTWSLGSIFLKRNMLVFDMDKKIIGFYNKDIEINDDPNKSKNKIIILIVSIVIASLIIIGLIGFIIYKYIYERKNKKAYELNENQDYDHTSNDVNSQKLIN